MWVILETVLYTSELVTPIIHFSDNSRRTSIDKRTFCFFFSNSRVFCGLECAFPTIPKQDLALIRRRDSFLNNKVRSLIALFNMYKFISCFSFQLNQQQFLTIFSCRSFLLEYFLVSIFRCILIGLQLFWGYTFILSWKTNTFSGL